MLDWPAQCRAARGAMTGSRRLLSRFGRIGRPSMLQFPLSVHLESLPPEWRAVAQRFLASPPGLALQHFLAERVQIGATVYPPRPLHALELTPLASVRAVILGQDPYHRIGQAHGLAFSVPDGVRPPPSLRNIFLELKGDVGCSIPHSGNLERWAGQGVLLLNTVLTVEDGQPAAHAGKGWEIFTDTLIDALAEDARPKVFLLWGAQAQAKQPRIAGVARAHGVLTANHPSPLSARRGPQPFLGCRHFSQANAFLLARGRGQIDWCDG
jgi:uracil-DNA glycosylase